MNNRLLATLLCLMAVGCSGPQRPVSHTVVGPKIAGVAFVAPRDSIPDTAYAAVKRSHVRWVALMPYGYTEGTTPSFVYGTTKQWRWWGESPAGVEHCVRLAHAQGLKVMLKPHVWIGHGMFTGHFALQSEEEWKIFERDFGRYLLDYARLAETTGVELYCIATEMQAFVKARPQFWFGIIRQIRQIYHGRLTYAENWDAYQDVPFWSQLDYIGIDAYFPLSEEQSPTLAELRKGWHVHLRDIERFSEKTQKPVLFTEYGYMSSDYAARRPWETDRDRPANDALQARAYEALFAEAWARQWLAGGFAWKWFPGLPADQRAHDPFSPQHKAAARIMQEHYGSSR